MMLRDQIFWKGWLTAILQFLSLTCGAQSIRFSNFYDSNNGAGLIESVVVLDNGNLLGVGSNLNVGNANNQDGHHVMIDESGNLLNDYSFVFSGKTFNTQQVMHDKITGSLYASGYYCDFTVQSPSYCDFYFNKLDGTGDTLFTSVLESRDTCDYLLDMVQTRPNKIMLIGWTCNDTTQNNTELMFITVDTLGNELNRVVWGGGGTDYVHSGTVINEMGDVLMTGSTQSFQGGDNDTWLVKTDSVGNVLWQQTYNHLSPSGGDGGTEVLKLTDGNFAIVGGSQNSSTGNSDGFILKVNPNGDEIWTKKYVAPSGTQSLWAGAVLADGNILSCGQTTNTNDGSQAGWLIKTDENGDTLWTRIYNPSSLIDRLLNMLVMPNGDIVMAGSGRDTGQTNQDGWILRVDSMGCVVENCHITGVNDELEIRDEKLRVWPNPTSSIIYIESTERLNDLTLFDLRGKMLLSATNNSIDLSVLPDGMYLLQARDVKGNSYTQKVMKR